MDTNQLAGKYLGQAAEGYDQRRTKLAKWSHEQAAVEDLLSVIPNASRILDVPVGTGRFLSLYARRNFNVTGVDISPDMLAEAKQKAATLNLDADLELGSIFELPKASASFDAVVCIRMLNWFEPPDMAKAVAELARVSRGPVILSIRTFAENVSPGRAASIAAEKMFRKLFSGKPNGGATTVHRKADFDRALADARLRIAEERLVKAGRRDTDYMFLRVEPL